jgi:mannose-6-phosphate isomerase
MNLASGTRNPQHWLYSDALPFWTARALDERYGGFFDRLSQTGEPYVDDPKTTLVQARMLFTCAHARLAGGGAECEAGAEAALAFLTAHLFDREAGGFFRAVGRSGDAAAADADRVKDAYDHAFVLLGLGAYFRLNPSQVVRTWIKRTFSWFHEALFDEATGGYHEDSRVHVPGEAYPLPRRQNPHMHLFEALLALYEATGERIWLDHARRILSLFRTYFFDRRTGSVREFLDHRLDQAPRPLGCIREPGHQFEWVWLLQRYAALSGENSEEHASSLYGFGLNTGLHQTGPLAGAVYDEVAQSGAPLKTSLLLWPQTEGVKAHLARFESTKDSGAMALATSLARLIFANYIATDTPVWRNQIDTEGRTLQADAPTRLLYHVAMFITEGHRLGAWQGQDWYTEPPNQ